MELSEELLWRGFCAETTIKNASDLDSRASKKFYWGADPSADTLTIGNLAALMMCACFIRHGYQPYLLVGGATGQIGDPKENSERELKTLDEVAHNKACIKQQISTIIAAPNVTMVDNLDWFKDLRYLDFLREVGKAFSMTQLLDRQFVQNRIGLGGAGISYAEFSYTLIQGYDFLHLYRQYGIDLQLCGADQYGNCTSGIHLIRRLANATADVWSTPLVIDPVTGRKFGKSEGNAIWLTATDQGSGNFTPIFDFYQFWLGQPDSAVESLLKIYTLLDKDNIDKILHQHQQQPEQRIAQRALALGATEVVHGHDSAAQVQKLSDLLFSSDTKTSDFAPYTQFLPSVSASTPILDALFSTSLANSKTVARQLLKQGSISLNGAKITSEQASLQPGILKKGKNKFAIVTA